jgi:hypothetical protein
MTLPSVLLKLDRARHHISDLDTEVRNFLHSRPFEVDHHEHGNPEMAEWILTRETPVPPVISAIAGDAIQNLRTALDYIVCVMVEINQNRVSSESGFPISKSLAAYQNPNTQKKLDGISAEARSFIDSLRPYAGGDDTLWLLHRLNNRDKHRLLLSAGCAVVEHDILPSQREQLRELYQRVYPTLPPRHSRVCGSSLKTSVSQYGWVRSSCPSPKKTWKTTSVSSWESRSTSPGSRRVSGSATR